MIRCAHYPTCRERPLWVPVISIPTYRVSLEGVVTTSDKPTLLIGKDVCPNHKAKWNFFDWFHPSDWKDLIDAAREKNLVIREHDPVHIIWRPSGWEPGRYLELERTQ